MTITSEYVRSYPLKQLQNPPKIDNKIFGFRFLNDQMKFEKYAFGNMIIMPNTGGTAGIRNRELNADIVFWNRKK